MYDVNYTFDAFVYASSDENVMLASEFEEHRDNLKKL